MDVWETAMIVIGVAAALTVFGLTLSAFIEVIRDERLDTLSQGIWLLGFFVAPFVGVLAWYYLKPRRLTTFQPCSGRRTNLGSRVCFPRPTTQELSTRWPSSDFPSAEWPCLRLIR